MAYTATLGRVAVTHHGRFDLPCSYALGLSCRTGNQVPSVWLGFAGEREVHSINGG